jgi:hypothetical protein
MDWQDLTTDSRKTLQWSCLKTKIVERACDWVYATSPEDEAAALEELRLWSRIHASAFLTSIDHPVMPPLTVDMVLVDLFAECTGVCQFCAAIAVQFHPPDVNLSNLINDTVPSRKFNDELP